MRIGLDILITWLSVEQRLVALFQPYLPGMQGASIALCIELKQILSAHPANVAQHVAERFTIGVIAGQLCVDHNPGQLMQIDRDLSQRRVVQTQFDRHRLEGSATLRAFLKRL